MGRELSTVRWFLTCRIMRVPYPPISAHKRCYDFPLILLVCWWAAMFYGILNYFVLDCCVLCLMIDLIGGIVINPFMAWYLIVGGNDIVIWYIRWLYGCYVNFVAYVLEFILEFSNDHVRVVWFPKCEF